MFQVPSRRPRPQQRHFPFRWPSCACRYSPQHRRPTIITDDLFVYNLPTSVRGKAGKQAMRLSNSAVTFLCALALGACPRVCTHRGQMLSELSAEDLSETEGRTALSWPVTMATLQLSGICTFTGPESCMHRRSCPSCRSTWHITFLVHEVGDNTRSPQPHRQNRK